MSPIVFAYNYKGELCFVLVRRAWRYIILDPEEVFWPPEILFKGMNHHQFVRRISDASGTFAVTNLSKLSSVDATEYRVATLPAGTRSIPLWNIAGLSRNIYEKAEEILSE